MMDEKQVKRLNSEVPELWGALAVARAIGVSPTNLARVRGLPAPALELSRGRLWRADVVRDFANNR